MVEIDYYSKYLKYKQKYLKQKNLQIGGKAISVDIKLEIYKSTQLYINQNLESANIIKDEIDKWLLQQNIDFKNYSIIKLNKFVENKPTQKIILDVTKTFDFYGIRDKNIIIISLPKSQ